MRLDGQAAAPQEGAGKTAAQCSTANSATERNPQLPDLG